MEIKYNNFISYEEIIKNIDAEEMEKLLEKARIEREAAYANHNTYFSTGERMHDVGARTIYSKIYERSGYKNESALVKGIIAANAQFPNSNKFINYLPFKFETLKALIDVIIRVRDAKKRGNMTRSEKTLEAIANKHINTIMQKIKIYSPVENPEVVINKISCIISATILENINSCSQEINQEIYKRTNCNNTIDLIFTNWNIQNGNPTINCTYVYRSKNFITDPEVINSLSLMEDLTEICKKWGIVFHYTIISSKDFEKTYKTTDEFGNTTYDEEVLKTIAPSTLLRCENKEYLSLFDSINNIKNGKKLTKTNPDITTALPQ